MNPGAVRIFSSCSSKVLTAGISRWMSMGIRGKSCPTIYVIRHPAGWVALWRSGTLFDSLPDS